MDLYVAICNFFLAPGADLTASGSARLWDERKKAIYDICIKYGALSSSHWAHLDLISKIGERYYYCGG